MFVATGARDRLLGLETNTFFTTVSGAVGLTGVLAAVAAAMGIGGFATIRRVRV
jgi:hypothetical protein